MKIDKKIKRIAIKSVRDIIAYFVAGSNFDKYGIAKLLQELYTDNETCTNWIQTKYFIIHYSLDFNEPFFVEIETKKNETDFAKCYDCGLAIAKIKGMPYIIDIECNMYPFAVSFEEFRFNTKILKSVKIENGFLWKFFIYRQLKILHLTNIETPTQFSRIIKNQKQLELCIAEGQIPQLPKTIGNLTKLKTLDLFECEIEQLPNEIGKLKNLEKLNLWRNKLTALPQGIGELCALKNINLSENQLKTLPETFYNLSAVEEINLTQNCLDNISTSINKLQNLKILNLHYNQLTHLPAEIGELSQLKELKLSRNKLQSLPTEMSNLKTLETLVLSNNLFTELPDFLQHLKNIKNLTIGNNKFTAIPEVVYKMTQLENFGAEYIYHS